MEPDTATVQDHSKYTYDGDPNAVDHLEWPTAPGTGPDGKTLYYFSGDHTPEDKNGDGLGGEWHLYEEPTTPVATDNIGPTPPATDPALASQGQAEPQVVPEQRPQAFIAPTGGVSESSKRLDNNEPATQEEIDRANSQEAKDASAANSLTPRLFEGQRVTFVSGPEQGRMGFVSQVVFPDAVQQMISTSGIPQARFAEVAQYIIRTRDGRSDIISATPDQIKPLDDIEGWGRGQI